MALLLLCQTALDLANPALCALDADEFAPVGVAAGTLVLTAATSAAHPGPADAAEHVDDCFCCSGCVEAQQIFHVLPVTPAARKPHTEAEKRVSLLPATFDHPPQLLI